jgi:hypothetical protein
VLPLMCVGAGLAIQEMSGVTSPAPGEVERRLLSHPVFLGGMVLLVAVASAAGMVYWMANCAVVAAKSPVTAAWRESLRFCRRNFPAVLAVWLVNLVVGVALAPLGLLGQLGVVTNPWALSAVALAYSALVGYWGVILAGLTMSLYLGRRTPSGSPAVPAVPVAVEA